MNTQIITKHTNVVAVQPIATFDNQDHMNKRSFNTLKLVIFFALAIMMAMPAMAATCNDHSCTGQIARVYVTSSANQPTVYVSMVGGTTGLNCTLASGVYFTLPSTQLGYAQQYDLLLQAKIANTTVIIRPIVPSNGCVISYVVAGQ